MIKFEAAQGLDCPVTLEQKSKQVFIVTYDMQVNKFSNIYKAMIEFNNCVLHSIECTGAKVY